jgi:signal transduction histidine kinase
MEKKPAQIQLVTRKLKKSIRITFSDNGKGISAERLSRIFEPFYTTKPPGKGTGLGLSISQRIIKQHGGTIQVKSKPDTGSLFTVTLPIISAGFPYES